MNVVDRIKKLLRLSKSPNIHEAKLALDRAFEIAAKYQVDIQTLDLGEDLNAIVTEAVRVGYRLPLTKRLAVGLASRFFNVQAVLTYPDVVLIGTKADIAVARYVIDYLARTVEACAHAERRQHGLRFTENRRRNYVAGFFYAVSSSLDQEREQLMLTNNVYALTVTTGIEKRRKKEREIFPKTKPQHNPRPKRVDRNWLHAGWVAGKQVQIKPAVATSAPLVQIGESSVRSGAG